MRMTPMSMPTKSGLYVGMVPTLSGTVCCLASDPARPRAKIIGANLATSMTIPPAVLYQVVFVVRPANAEPLLLAIEVNAYTISVQPCAPGLTNDALGPLNASD